jgi:YggT family protein
MIHEILKLLVDTVGALFVGACLLRLWMQWLRIGMRNPLGEMVVALTDWIVRPLRRVVPGVGGVDWSSLIAAYLLAFFCVLLLVFSTSAWIGVIRLPGPDIFLGLALVWLVKWLLYVAFLVILIGAVLSWANPFSPVLPVFDALAAPLLRPIRRLFGPVGRFDFSPLVAALIIEVLLRVLQVGSYNWLGLY